MENLVSHNCKYLTSRLKFDFHAFELSAKTF